MHVQRNPAKRYALALLVVLAGCGRVGLDLLPLPAAGTDAGANDAGAGDGGASDAGMCADPGSSPTEGMCGCGIETSNDEDSDGVPDCMDFCPGMPDQRDATSCGCPAAEADADDDGVRNCFDRCPFDTMKSSPGLCGCGASDDDDDRDNTPNCQDDCPDDPDKSEPGVCGCGQSDRDTDLDGTPDCMDRCSGRTDDVYMPDGSCGVGYCRAHNAPSTCQQGMETACMAGEPLSTEPE